jgi:hypothetical protein
LRRRDYRNDYSIGAVGRAVISVRLGNYTYCHGTAYGFEGNKVQTYVLAGTARLLEAGRQLVKPIPQHLLVDAKSRLLET